MFDVSISQMTTLKWHFADEVGRLADHGFDAMAVWRPKVTDVGVAAAASQIASAGMRVSSVHWAGGFTGGDGRSFEDSLDDACDAIDMAEGLQAGAVILQSGSRGGHTRSHAARLLWQALETLAPRAARAGVVLAIEPMHPAAASEYSFLNRLVDAVSLVEQFDDGAVRLGLDLWHWADDPQAPLLLTRLAAATTIVQVADRVGPPTAGGERLPTQRGRLPLEFMLGDLVAAGFRGDVEFDPVGEAVEAEGYDGVLADTQSVAAAWSSRLAAEFSQPVELPRPHVRAGHFRGAGLSRGAGCLRSQASSQTVSPG